MSTNKRYWRVVRIDNKRPEMTDWSRLADPDVRAFAVRLSGAVQDAITNGDYGWVEGLREALRHLAQSFDAA